MPEAALLPRARVASRLVVLGALGGGALLRRRPPGGAAQQALVLAALALGMPHGASDTELLRTAAHGSRARHAGLLGAYSLLATGATVVVRRGGPLVERGVLVASAAHFGEGELACWPVPPGGRPRTRAALRLAGAALTSVVLPALIGVADRRPAEVGVHGALSSGPTRAIGERTGLALLRAGGGRRTVAPVAALSAAALVGLAATGDRTAAADTALLLALDLLAPPSLSFAAYFGGWHSLRHTARVVDALVADGELPAQRSLARAVLALGRRSAWAAGVGLVGAAALAVADPEAASDNAFAAVLGLTVPHMTTVALELTRRGR